MITAHRSKLRVVLTLLFAPTAITSTSFAFAEIARGALLFQTSGSATYDSYFLGTLDNSPDTIYTIYPSLRYTRNAGRGTISANTGVAFNKYQKNTDLDSDDLRANISVELPVVEGARLNGNVSVDYNEATVVDLYVNDRVATQSFAANLGLDYRLGDRTSLSESFGYNKSIREIYSDQEMFSNLLSFTYEGFLRGTSLTLSHAVTLTNTSGDAFTGIGLDQESHNVRAGLSRPIYGEIAGSLMFGYSVLNRSEVETFNGEARSTSGYVSASIDGPFLPRRYFPKLTSSASISYSQSAMAGINENASKFLSGRVSVGWNARERTKFNISASRSLDLSITNLTVENTRLAAGFDQQIGRSTSLAGSTSYTWSDYRGVERKDSVLEAGLTLSRNFNKYLSASAGYTFQDNDTSFSGFQPGRFAPEDYIRHTATGTITVTF